MSSREWQQFKIGDLSLWRSGGTPPKNDMECWGGNIPWISAKTLKGGKVCNSDTKISQKGLDVGSKIANKDTILLLVRGSGLFNGIPIGIVEEPVAFNQDVKAIEVTKDFVEPLYLYYWLVANKPLISSKVEYTGIGAGKLDTDLMKQLAIDVPPKSEQSAITKILSCLDDLIELNNHTNQVLEEIAQAIFKRWFVDFEFPNEEGEPYKSSGGELVESELGEIPKGWDIGNLLDIADYLNGLAMQNFRPKENEKAYPVLKIKELRQGTTDSNSELCSVNINQNYIVDDGDLIFSWSGSLIVDFWCGGRCGLNQHLFKVTSNKFDKWYYYYWTNFHLQKFIGIAKDKATTMGHIKREDLKNSKVLIMDDITYQRLSSISNPIFETIIANRVENRKLATIRDTLLPKLMSGEIRVPVEEVV